MKTYIALFLLCAPIISCGKPESDLRGQLEGIYAQYLEAIEKEDADLLLSTLPAGRIADLEKAFAANRMRFPDDYFDVFKKFSPAMPPVEGFRFVATTESPEYANLIYVGNINGYLRATRDEERFLVIQFEKTPDGWKYAVIIDPPLSAVPDALKKIEEGDLEFIESPPFSAQMIPLTP